MNGRYHLATIKPEIDKVGNVAFTPDDVLFDWTKFEVPRGGCAIRSLNLIVAGTNGAAANGGLQMDLYFATSVNGASPPTLGNTNTAMNVISATAAKPYIIAYHGVVGSEMEDSLDGMVGFNVLGKGVTSTPILVPSDDSVHATITTSTAPNNLTILEGDPNYDGATSGYQTIWVAGVAQGAYDFGSDVLVAGQHSADDLTIVVDGTPGGDDMFAIGDTITAFANDGSAAKVIGNLTAVADDLLTVDAAPVILPNDHEICNLNPIVIKLGLEY